MYYDPFIICNNISVFTVTGKAPEKPGDRYDPGQAMVFGDDEQKQLQSLEQEVVESVAGMIISRMLWFSWVVGE